MKYFYTMVPETSGRVQMVNKKVDGRFLPHEAANLFAMAFDVYFQHTTRQYYVGPSGMLYP